MIMYIVSGGLLAAAFVTDISREKIPNLLTISGLATGIALHWGFDGAAGAVYALLGAVLGFIPLLLLHLIRAVGAGDVKLFAALGALAGGELVLQSVMYSLIYAAVIGCLILLWRWEWKERGTAIAGFLLRLLLWKDTGHLISFRNASDHLRFPFMWAVLPAFATAYFQIT